MARYTTVFPYYGGKANMLPALLQLLPTHQTYCEVFGGSGVLLLNKPRSSSELEIYNDIEGHLVNFFKVLRDSPDELESQLRNTMFSREEYCYARDILAGPPIFGAMETARCWYVVARQSFAATAGTGGWRVVKTSDPTESWNNSIDRLSMFSERLSHVVIENLNWEAAMKKYDGPNTLFYMDPPYTLAQRTGGAAYRNELTQDQHRVLVDFVLKCKGKVILSGYSNNFYDMWLKDWDRYVIKVRSSAANSDARANEARDEVIWVKPNSRVQSSMWDQPLTEFIAVEEVKVE